jgi:hypothetical protein
MEMGTGVAANALSFHDNCTLTTGLNNTGILFISNSAVSSKPTRRSPATSAGATASRVQRDRANLPLLNGVWWLEAAKRGRRRKVFESPGFQAVEIDVMVRNTT